MKQSVVKLKYFQVGMSLVELMVAMVIGLFLTAGVFTMFNMSSSNVTTTSQLNQLQENGRIALAIMARDMTQLGFMGDMTGTDFILGSNTTVDAAISGKDCIGAGLNNATLPNNQPAHFRLLWGYTSGSGSSLACLSGVKSDTDVLQLKRLIGPTAVASTAGYYVASTSSQAIFFNSAAPSTTLPNARVWEYQHHVYYIDEANSIPMLNRKTLTNLGMNNDEQLVEGIENIRFLYGFDNDGNGTPDSFIPASAVTSLMWDNEGFQRLVAIKVYVLVRTIKVDSTYNTNKAVYQLGDKVINAPNDHFRRKVMSTTVVLENPLLIRS
ncbi:PilW family protein [Shewanella sp. MF08487]|uniref:PilW family protein n=1 Tax=Shewanella sp. MF08487 TaxID=3434873 RepID=UPI003D7B38B0